MSTPSESAAHQPTRLIVARRFAHLSAFAGGTLKGDAVAVSGATTVLAGGDTEAAVAEQAWVHHFTHISFGGGAALDFFGGRTPPGVSHP